MEDEHDNSRKGEDEMRKLVTTLKEKESGLARELEEVTKVLDEERKKSEENLTKLRYIQADFENYRRRVDREVQEIEEFSVSGLMRKLLSVIDDLDLAIASAEAQGDKSAFLEGVRMVSKNLNSILHGEGLRRIDSLGKPFNPDLHEAVDRVVSKRPGEDICVEEIRRGFRFKDRVLRPSMVKVELGARNSDENSKKVEPKEGESA